MLAVAGGKGGCGKTTTTAGLAAAWADAGADPLIVDADCDMPDLHLVAGARCDPGLDAVADGAGPVTVAQSAVELPGVRIVASGSDACPDLTTALSRVATAGRPTIVDTAAGASADVAAPIRAADAVALVSEPTPQSLTDAAKTAAMARELGTPVVGIVLTRCEEPVDPGPLLDAPVLARVPTARDPLETDAVRSAYDQAVGKIKNTTFNPGTP